MLRTAFALVLVAAAAGNSTGQGDQKVLRIAATSIPPTIVVVRGTVLEFYGELRKGSLPTTFQIRTGNTVRETVRTTDRWSLRWDTSRETAPRTFLLLWRVEPNGQEVRLGRCTVDVLDSAPFRLEIPSGMENTDGPLTLRVLAAGKLAPAGGDILIDGKKAPVALSPDGTASITLVGQKPGRHQVAAVVRTAEGTEFETDPVAVTLKETIRVGRGDVGPVDLSTRRTQVRLNIQALKDLKLKSVEYFLNGKSIGVRDTPPFNDVFLPEAGLSTGTYSLHAEALTEDGACHPPRPYRWRSSATRRPSTRNGGAASIPCWPRPGRPAAPSLPLREGPRSARETSPCGKY